ncbi:MAG TPA: SDR family oxidoreductase [Ilumatobacteraceae bacterium]|nr:SDR family oxidoreductase [Ilumatobacteraceae bacterium]
MTDARPTAGHRRLALVTGAGSGIGRATAIRLADDGYALALVDLDESALAATVELVGEHVAISVALDIRDVEGVDRLFRRIGSLDQPLWLLANVAGVGVRKDSASTSDEEWAHVLSINLTGTFVMCRAALPQLIAAGGGVIVNVASVAGLVGIRERAAYCASKAGVIGLTRAIAVDHSGEGVRATALCPGTVDTEWIGRILGGAEDPTAARALMAARQLDGRLGAPEEVAAGIAFLASDDGRFVNGAAWVMDGGMSAA